MDYGELSRLSALRVPPDNWSIVVADIRGSTEAIAAGRYHDVNLVGAACIAAIRNEFRPTDLPYVFGGDGATFLVSEKNIERCLEILEGVRQLSVHSLGLNLMIGHMTVGAVRSEGHSIYFGFLNWNHSESLPFFRGSGIRFAERVIKDLDSKNRSVKDDRSYQVANVAGLSCRLLPFRSTRGQILSATIEVVSRGEDEDSVLQTILGHLNAAGPIERLRPVSLESEKRPWLNPRWRTEALMQSKIMGSLLKARIKTIFESLLGTLLFRLNLKNSILGVPREYTEVMLKQTDWIKMDGDLRLVLDMTNAEVSGFLDLLRELEGAGRIRFGSHISSGTVMTCHFQSAKEHQHTHFIDGLGGGLTQASVQLKRKKEGHSPKSFPEAG